MVINPILVSYIAKGLLPCRGLDSGTKQALEDWPEIDFVDDREANLFTSTVHRNESVNAEIVGDDGKTLGKTPDRILLLLKENPNLAIPASVSQGAIRLVVSEVSGTESIR